MRIFSLVCYGVGICWGKCGDVLLVMFASVDKGVGNSGIWRQQPLLLIALNLYCIQLVFHASASDFIH